MLILRGAGRAFCAGYDLAEDAERRHEGFRRLVRGAQHSADEMLKFFDHPKPIIAQVQSFCLAGGAT